MSSNQTKKSHIAIKPRLHLFHGWASQAAIWQSIAEQLSPYFDITTHDLPGHGCQSSVLNEKHYTQSLSDYVSTILDAEAAPVYLLGWSLGSLVCQQAAQDYPDRIKGIICIAGNLSFTEKPHYKTAMKISDFNHFYEQLSINPAQTVKRFMALQMLGHVDNKTLTKQVVSNLPDCPATHAGLNLGMQWLRDTDFSQSPHRCPSLWVLGGMDKIVPVEAAEPLKQNRQAEVSIIEAASHIPFITHQQACVDSILNWLSAHNAGSTR